MKYNIKKMLISLFAVAMMVLSAVLATGCYLINSGKMEKVVGTYQLTSYSTDVDELAKREITCYIVIRADGTGWYAYRDNDTPLHVSELRCRFTADAEKQGHYSYVEMEFTNTNNWSNFGINVSDKSLNFSKPKYKGNLFEGTLAIDYYIRVKFTRVDKATDTSYITKTLGKCVSIPYGTTILDGLYTFATVQCDDINFPQDAYATPFVYSYLNINVYTGKGEAWYMLKADEVAHNQTFSFTVKKTDNGFTFSLNSVQATLPTVNAYNRVLGLPTQTTIDGTTYSIRLEHHYIGDDSVYNIDDEIAQKVEVYNAEKGSATT